MKDLLIYGFGGYGREVASIIKSINEIKPEWNVLGYIDDRAPIGSSNRYGKVIGDMDYLNNYSKPLSVVFAIASPAVLKYLCPKINNKMISFPNIIAPTVLFFDRESITMGQGNILSHNCRISSDVVLGDFNIQNGSVSLGHDVKIGSFNVMQPETRISGDATVGNENYFGARCLVLQGLGIGNKTRIGTGSVVMRSTKDGFTYFGNPAKIMRTG